MRSRSLALLFACSLVVQGVLMAATAGRSPAPRPTSPDVWVDQDQFVRQCEGWSPCVPQLSIALGIADPNGRVFVYAMPWSYNESVVITKPVTLTGQNRSVIIDARAAPFAVNVSANDVRIENMTIGGATVGVLVNGAQNATIRNVSFVAVSEAVSIRDGTNVTVEGSEIRDPGSSGVVVVAGRGIVVNATRIDGGGFGLFATGVDGLVVAGSQFLRTGVAGVQVTNSANVRIGATNIVSGNAGRGIWVDGSDGVAIVGNTIRDNALAGLTFNASVNVLVDRNVITANGRLGIPPRPGPSPFQGGGGGVRFLQTDPVLVANNTISGNEFFGVAITGNASKDFTLRGNTIANNTGPGLLLADGATRIDVSGVFRDNHGDAVAMDNVTAVSVHDSIAIGNWYRGVTGAYATNVTVANNTFQGNFLGGVRFLQTDPSAIRSNLISGNFGPGIALLSTVDFEVSDNTVDDNMAYGLQLQDAARTRVTGNRVHGHPYSLSQVAGDVTASRNLFANATSEAVSLDGGARFTGTNDSFAGSRYAFLLFNGSRAIVLNESFFAASSRVLDPLSNLTVEWFLHVSVIDAGGSPAPGATVRVLDATPSEVFNGTADAGGNRSWIVLTWFDMTGTATYVHTPHDARAYVSGPDEGSVAVTMDASKSVTIQLVRDLVPPTITNLTAIPDPQEQSQAVDVSAEVTDAHLSSVFLNVTYPDSSSVNASMALAGGNRFNLSRAYALVGPYSYSIVASDTFGNVATGGGTFRILPPNPAPSIANVTATPDPAEAGSAVNITATIQDADGIDLAFVDVTLPDNSVVTTALTRAGATWYAQRTYALLGSHAFMITAMDANATFPRTSTATGSFTVRDTTLPVANAGPDQTVPQNALVRFDGTGSSDFVGIVNYTWTFADGSVRTLYGASPSYRFTNAGAFVVTLNVRDGSGNIGADDLIVTVGDTTPPTVSTPVATPNTVEAPENTTITFTAADNVAISGAWVEGWTPAMTSVGNVSVFVPPGTFNPSTWFLNALGPYRFVVSVQDTAGNWAVRQVVVLSEDTTAPAFLGVGSAPTTAQVLSPVILWAQVSDPYLDTSSLKVTVRNPSGAVVGNFTLTYNAVRLRYEYSFTPAVLGTYSFTVWALDTSGNFASGPGTFVSRDTIAPTIASVAVAPQPQDVGSVVNVSAAVTDDYALGSVSIDLLYPNGTALGTFAMLLGADTRWHDTRAYALKGIWSFTVHAVDTSGNTAAPFSGTISIVDRAPPSVTGITKTPSSTERGDLVAVNATVTDNIAVALVSLEVTDPLGSPPGNFTMACDAAGLCGFARTYNVAGTYTLRVWGADTSGNVASAAVTLTIVEGADPTANAGSDVAIDLGQSVIFNGSGSSDDYGIVSYEWTFTHDGQPIVLTGVTPSAFEFNVSGTYTVTLTVQDAAGHGATDTMTVTVRSASGGVGFDPSLLVPLALIIFLVLAFAIRWMRSRAASREEAPEEPGQESEESAPEAAEDGTEAEGESEPAPREEEKL